ncbi:redox-sensing transcriptional repressor Rex [Plantactinospora sp. CA-290183]|uniref:redox-sensing transcriptional repressor Rex n=1 Tax=Plantactinospora sp. CA-290183 TaxID=3240006 RepID=UPI003D8D63AF
MSQHRHPGTPGRAGAVPALPDLPEATVARLPEYLRALHNLAEAGNDTVSSEELATAAGVNSAKLRKDLSQLGSYGTRGVGYDVALLIDQIEFVLGLTQRRAVALVGVGNLGHALAGYAGFAGRGFRIAALFDADAGRVGEEINGLVVRHIDEFARVAAEESIAIGVIATPATAAQGVADQLVAAGVTSILNFAPCVLSVPDGVDVRKVDLAIELQILSFHEHRKSALTGLPVAPGVGRSAAGGGGLTPGGGLAGPTAGLTALPGGLAATGTTESTPTGPLRSTNAEAVGT